MVDPIVAAFEQACALQADGAWAPAAQAFEALLRMAPAGHEAVAPAWANLGLARDELGLRDDARAAYEAALALQPDAYEARLHLGQWWMKAPPQPGGPNPAELAEHHLQLAARARPEAAAPWSTLGALLTCAHRDADAEACLRHALALAPNNDGARFNLAALTLRQGRFEEGWACLEARDATGPIARALPWPRWAGEPLAGRHIVLVSDAGHGDLIQFWRFLPWLHALGAGQVSWLVQAPLMPLLRAQPGVGPLHVLGEPWPADRLDGPDAPQVWAPVMSLPWLCAPHAAQAHPGGPGWPQALPYLWPPVPRHPTARPLGPRRVGLVWHGNPRHENDAERSLPGLHTLAPLWATSGPEVEFIDLQPGEGGSAAPGQGPVTRGPRLNDFADAAQALASLDLLVTVDTAYAHLAGALGVPVWVLLPHWKTDWRWLLNRSDSPWYPGVMRLFRQTQRGDWAGVVAQVAQALKQVPQG